MDDQVGRRLGRWREVEAHGRDEEADAAFGELFRSVARTPAVSTDFTARTLAAVSSAAERDARRARRVRQVIVPAMALGLSLGAYFGSGLLAATVSAAMISLLDLLISAVVAAATVAESGPDGWSVLSSVGRATAAVISNPTVTVTVFAMQGFAIAALIVLRRLLGADRESFR